MSIPKPGHTTGGSGRDDRRGGRAGSGTIGCHQNCLPRKQRSLVPAKASKIRRLKVSPEARTSEILCKPSAGTKSPVDNRFICGLSSVYQRDRERSLFLAADQWTDAFLFLPDMPCMKKAVSDMPCMKRVYRDKKATVHWSAARKKERFSPR